MTMTTAALLDAATARCCRAGCSSAFVIIFALMPDTLETLTQRLNQRPRFSKAHARYGLPILFALLFLFHHRSFIGAWCCSNRCVTAT